MTTAHRCARGRWRLWVAVTAAAVTATGALSPPPVQAAVARSSTHGKGARQSIDAHPLPSPPRPVSARPAEPATWTPPPPPKRHKHSGGGLSALRGLAVSPASTGSATLRASSRATPANDPLAPATATTWNAGGATTTLVVYDSTNNYGWLGELYAIAAGNLASHFGQVTAEPVVDYRSGQVENYTSMLYVGSTYNEPLPVTFLADVMATTHPVVWAGDNIWQLSGLPGSPLNSAFQATYGWDPSTTYFDTADQIASVDYKGTSLTRSTLNIGGVLAPHVTQPSQVTVLASAVCAGTCDPIAQTTGSSFPWAIRSSNLTFVGEVPFSYMTESDRYLAYADLLFNALAPGAVPSKQAMIRLEDVNAESDPAQLTQFAGWLKSQGVPFSVGVIPRYTDPNGAYNNGVPRTVNIGQRKLLVRAFKTMVADGGTLIDHGYTHQYSNVPNPYNGVTADDFEFFRAQCSATVSPPYSFDAACPATDWVVQEGPLPGDSALWAQRRASSAKALFGNAGLPVPTIWETPHYAASAPDYAGIQNVYHTRYEREYFFGGALSGKPTTAHIFGQFFPYTIHDLYGTTVLPEDLGNYEPETSNHNVPRLPADILANGAANQVVTQAVGSFFFHPYYPIDQMEQIVTGLVAQGYTFVSAATMATE